MLTMTGFRSSAAGTGAEGNLVVNTLYHDQHSSSNLQDQSHFKNKQSVLSDMLLKVGRGLGFGLFCLHWGAGMRASLVPVPS